MDHRSPQWQPETEAQFVSLLVAALLALVGYACFVWCALRPRSFWQFVERYHLVQRFYF